MHASRYPIVQTKVVRSLFFQLLANSTEHPSEVEALQKEKKKQQEDERQKKAENAEQRKREREEKQEKQKAEQEQKEQVKKGKASMAAPRTPLFDKIRDKIESTKK